MNEIWKDVGGYEGIYKVSNLGKVKSLDRFTKYKNTDFKMRRKGVTLKPNKITKGYLQVRLHKNGKAKDYLIHRLVMNAFNPTDNSNLEVNHIDGNKENNMLTNLEWVTPKENVRHAHINGLADNTRGNNKKLNENQVFETIELSKTGKYTQKEIGRKFGVNRDTVRAILQGKYWGWLTGITQSEIESVDPILMQIAKEVE